jgi:hypothetical protein
MDSFKLSIIDDTNKVSNLFIKANNFILSKYSDKFTEKSIGLKTQLLKEIWRAEYKAELVFKEQTPYNLFFENKKDYTMFLLRWS